MGGVSQNVKAVTIWVDVIGKIYRGEAMTTPLAGMLLVQRSQGMPRHSHEGSSTKQAPSTKNWHNHQILTSHNHGKQII